MELRHVGTNAPRRVLVVDDNTDAAESLALLLRSFGHEVRTANDGLTALEMAQTFQPEVVLLDLGMPRMDGHEVAHRLRQGPAVPKVLIVAVTGYGEEELEDLGNKDFNACLTKPVDVEALQKLLAGGTKGP
jgi:CheY-like chemotaxis protein